MFPIAIKRNLFYIKKNEISMPSSDIKSSLGSSRYWLLMASFVVIVAGMKAAATIIVPFLLAVFIAAICAPPFFWMQKKGLHQGISLLFVVLGIILITIFIVALMGSSVNNFMDALPSYQARLDAMYHNFTSWLTNKGLYENETNFLDQITPGSVMQFAGNLFSGLSQLLSKFLMILILVIFILLELSLFRKKIKINSTSALLSVDKVVSNLNRYFGIKTIVSLATGTFVAIAMAVVGVDFPVLWGALAFLLNFIPNIGSIIAAIPAVLLALIQLGTLEAAIVAIIYTILNFTIGSIIEPKLMGRNLGLSTLIIFISLVFWGWILGTVGMLLSIPLTMTIKIILDSHENTRWLGVLIGDENSLDGYIEKKIPPTK